MTDEAENTSDDDELRTFFGELAMHDRFIQAVTGEGGGTQRALWLYPGEALTLIRTLISLGAADARGAYLLDVIRPQVDTLFAPPAAGTDQPFGGG